MAGRAAASHPSAPAPCRSGARGSDGAKLAPGKLRKGSKMSIKLNDKQGELLGSALARPDKCLALSSGPKLAPTRKAAAKLLEAGLLREVRAKKDAPVWRRDETSGYEYALKLTAEGAKTAALCTVSDDSTDAKQTPTSAALPGSGVEPVASIPVDSGDAAAPAGGHSALRPGSKIAEVVVLLARPDGATIGDLIAITGWLPHTTRAALTGLRKRGFVLALDRADRGSRYRIVDADRDNATEGGSAPANPNRKPKRLSMAAQAGASEGQPGAR